MSFLSTSFSSQRLGASDPTVAQASAPVASPVAPTALNSPVASPAPAPVASPNTAMTKNESTLSLADKKEIHNAKMGASVVAGVLGFWGFSKPLWDSLFYNPNRAAKKRLDVKSGQRSELSGELLEEQKKKAQIKAAIIPAIIGMVTLSFIPLLCWKGTLGGLGTALLYMFFEKPEAPDFNEKL